MEGIGQFIPLILIITVIVVVIKLRNKGRETRIEEFNKKHGTNFKNELELNYFVATKLDKKKEVDQENNSNIPTNVDKDFSKEEDIGASLKRLKKMYNDGHLTKVEFEKAKNKLLKQIYRNLWDNYSKTIAQGDKLKNFTY